MIPNFLKPIIRFAYYKNERKKIFRELSIRKKQNSLFVERLPKDTEHLIVFLVDGTNWFSGTDTISGGILSIASIYEESLKLRNIHQSEVIMVTHPDAHLLLKHIQFPNDIFVYRFKQLKKIKHLKSLLIHIPEYFVNKELINSIKTSFLYLNEQDIHLNILNQRIDIMPIPKVIKEIKDKGYQITQTTAHERYSTLEIKDKFGIPLHKLSVYATPERYKFTSFEEKENLILVSPDKGQLKTEILSKINKELPNYSVIIISGITYMEYLNLIDRAKYMITFGEGLDFYFIETVFSGGISFAVYNEEFFTSDFKGIDGIYETYEQLHSDIGNTINELAKSKENYSSINRQQFSACHKIYNDTYYKQNLINFYKKNYLLP